MSALDRVCADVRAASHGLGRLPGAHRDAVLAEMAAAVRTVRALPDPIGAVDRAGLELLGDASAGLTEAADADPDTEFLAMALAVRVVESLDEALEHIARHGSGHGEAIVTGSPGAAARFHEEVNAAEKLHARGPIGLAELTTYTYLVTGRGHVR